MASSSEGDGAAVAEITKDTSTSTVSRDVGTRVGGLEVGKGDGEWVGREVGLGDGTIVGASVVLGTKTAAVWLAPSTSAVVGRWSHSHVTAAVSYPGRTAHPSEENSSATASHQRHVGTTMGQEYSKK